MTEEKTEEAPENIIAEPEIYYVNLNARMFASFVDCFCLLGIFVFFPFLLHPIYEAVYTVFNIHPDIVGYKQATDGLKSFGHLFEIMAEYGILKRNAVDLIVTFILYGCFIVPFWIKFQATPGKIIIRAKIVDAKTREKPSTRQFIVRYVSYLFSAAPAFFGFVYSGMDKRRQALHDKIAGTMVIYTKRPWSASFLPKPKLSNVFKMYKDMVQELKRK